MNQPGSKQQYSGQQCSVKDFLRRSCCAVCCILLLAAECYCADASDCLWGGYNEQTNYTASYFPGQGGITLAQQTPPPMNLNAPQPSIPVQAAQNTQNINVPQANIPTVTIPAGAVGSVGQPATQIPPPQPVPGAMEIVYVMPIAAAAQAVCLDGQPGTPASEVKVVPAGTPGAIPVALKTVTVRRPKVKRNLSYSPIVTKTNTLVQVVHPRSGKVVKTYCREDEEKTCLPWLHLREETEYETVTAKVAVPISVAPTASAVTNTAILFHAQ
ncbi:MAG: hypothetical protein LBT89_05120 [Planctomycetaceae bacterium]|jgi:hypothetical protein|nr:hypothetical protein [Planctomycetaceae bacterium]